MNTLNYHIGQPTAITFKLRNDAGAYETLTNYGFTLAMTNYETGATFSYAIPATTTDTATMNLSLITSGGTAISTVPGLWYGRLTTTLNGSEYNVSAEFSLNIKS